MKINTRKLFIFFIIAAISFAIIGCNKNQETSSNERFEEKISLYKNQNIKKDFEKHSLGVGPWEIIYCKDDKLIFNNYKYTIGYSTKKDMEGIYSIIDLQNLGLHHVQGSIVSMLDISPKGKTLTGINIQCEEKIINIGPLHIINLITEDISELNVGKKEKLIPIALNSRYYVLYCDTIMIVNIETNEIKDVNYTGDTIENILIQDNGDIFIQDTHSSIYLLSKKENYKEIKTELVGTLFDTIGDDLIWFNKGNIYKGNILKHSKIKDIGTEWEFITCKNGRAIFASDSMPLVYDLKTNKIASFNQVLSVSEFYAFPNSVSPDMDKYITNPWSKIQMFDYKGKEYDVNIKDYSKAHLKHNYYLNSNSLWLDNENLIYIAQKEDTGNLDGLMIVKYNIKTGENIVLFEFK
ncbi:hypothetical protein [Oceanirhabdus seepicola]|uniref:Uncharacterized protein n=1 Tax=Oceanirhabdus seepicola TaxID=2828781 RepID=A0A9J6P017_9CLOT|nr:hypothetical protein [Oceanirhabdus seepicola]MCM1989213.1 hypothetical protein [Oceanirhabdus seepicola]